MRVTDRSNVRRWSREVEKLHRSRIEVGIFGTAGSEILLRAGANEFGVPQLNIPERSFIRAGYDRHIGSMREEMTLVYRMVVAGNMMADTAWNTIGESFVSKIQGYVDDLKTPPNAPATIAQKGSTNPLIDTGQMRDSITYRVISNV